MKHAARESIVSVPSAAVTTLDLAITMGDRTRAVPSISVIRLDAATVLLQWAAGGMLFGWFTTRRREVGVGYGWLLRIVYGTMAIGAVVTGLRYHTVPVREVSSGVTAASIIVAFAWSVVRRKRDVAAADGVEPRADLVAPLVASVGLVAAGLDGGGNHVVAIVRTLIGAAFLGAVTDAMLLGHWYLVQPGLPRRLLNELVRSLRYIWPFEVAALLLPTGMISVLAGTVDDGWNGTLGWMWLACAITTIVLVVVTEMALKERYYSAVMAATGLLYLAILTAFGTDLVARAVLS